MSLPSLEVYIFKRENIENSCTKVFKYLQLIDDYNIVPYCASDVTF